MPAVKQEEPPLTTPRHNQPDYNAHIDKATSCAFAPCLRVPSYQVSTLTHAGSTFTPVPKRVMDGSEDGDVLPAAVLSGAPMELQARTVRYVLAANDTLSSHLLSIPGHSTSRTCKI